MLRGLLAAIGIMASASCAGGTVEARIPTPEAPAFKLPTVYSGSLEIEGDRVPSRLRIQQAGEDLTSRLTARDIGMAADGTGTLRGHDVELMMAYGSECAGRARLIGRVAETTFFYTGRIVAADCTGDVEGSFVFAPDQTR